MEYTLIDEISERITRVQSNPSCALLEFHKLRAKYPPLLSGAHTRAFLSFAFGDVELKKSVEELTKVKSPSRVCGNLINRHDIMWKCDTCSLVPNACYCLSCFIPNSHEGHKYSFSLGASGTCDCGDTCCLKPDTFCPAHRESSEESKVSLQNLPSYIQAITPSIIQSFITNLHQVLCEFCCVPLEEAKDALGNISNALEALGVLMECHPALLNLICNELNKKAPGHFTAHRCLDMGEEGKGTVHLCGCSTLQCIVRNLPKLAGSANLVVSYKEVAKKNDKFGKGFYEAYFAFYEDLATDTTLVQHIEDIPFQAVEFKEFTQEVLRRHLPNYSNAVKNVIANYINDPKKEPTPFFFLYSTFLTLIMHQHYNNKLLIDELNFYETFVQLSAKLQAADYNHGGTHLRGEFFLSAIFAYGQIGYEFSIPVSPAVRRLLQRFRELIENDFNKNQEAYASSISFEEGPTFFMDNILYRLFGTYMNKLVTELMVSLGKKGMNEIKLIVKDCMGFATVEEMDGFLLKIILPTVRVLMNACLYRSVVMPTLTEDQKESLEIYYGKQANTFSIDITTVQVCITLVSEKASYVSELLFKHLLNPTIKNQPPEALAKYMESVSHLLGVILCNSQCRQYTYMSSAVRFVQRDVLPKHKELYSKLIRGEVMQRLMQEKYESEKFKCLQLHEIVTNLPYDLRANQVEDELTNILSVNAANTGYTITKDNLKDISLFNHINVEGLHSFEQNFKNILSHLRIEGDYNLLENSAKQEGILGTIQDEIMSKIDLNVSFTELVKGIIISNAQVHSADFTKISAICILYALLEHSSIPEKILDDKETVLKLAAALKEITSKKGLYSQGIKAILDLLAKYHPEVAALEYEISPTAQISKEEKKKKQAEIMARFESQRKKFSEAHKEAMLLSEPFYKTDIICGLCRESINPIKETERPYGQICFMSQIKIFAHVLRQELDRIAYQWHLNQTYIEPVCEDEQISKVARSGISMNACGHYMHLDCSRKYKEELDKEGKSFNCPVCKVKANAVMPTATTSLDLQTMYSVCEIFKKFISLKEGEEYISYEHMKELHKVLSLALVYLVQSVRIIGVESVFKKHGKLLGNLFQLFNWSLSPYSREFITKDLVSANLLKTTSVFSVDSVSEIVAKVSTPRPAGDNYKDEIYKAMSTVYLQSTLKHTLEFLARKRLEFASSVDLVIKEMLRCRKDHESEILQDCVSFLEKCVAAVAIVNNWEEDKCKQAIEFLNNKKEIYEKAAELGFLLNLGDGICVELAKLSENDISVEYVYGELIKYAAECQEMYEKYQESIKDTKDRFISFVMHAKVSIKASPLTFNLINLPEDYEGVVLRYSAINCENCCKNSPNKSVCLICGGIVCYNSECCKNIEATAHAMYCNTGRGVFLSVYHGNLILVSNMRSIEDDTGLYKNALSHDVCEYLKRLGEKHSAQLAQYKLDRKRYDQLREIIAQGQELQALDSAASKNPQTCPIF